MVEEFVAGLLENGYPKLHTMLCIGGIDTRSQVEVVKHGVHVVVATPKQDLLAKMKMDIGNCKVLALDEADRLLDARFEDDIQEIIDQ